MKYRYFICFLIFSCYVLVFFHRLCPAVIALDLQNSFHISGTLLGLLASAYFYSYAIMQLPTGLMADSWGPRKTVSIFFILAGVGSILMGVASNLTVAIIGRVLVGIGVSTVFVCNFKILAEWFTPRQFLIMGSAFMVMGGLGALFSSAPLAWISELIGWRMTLTAVGIFTLVMSALTYAFVRNKPSDMGLPSIRKDSPRTEKGMGLLAGMKMVITSGRFWPLATWSFCVTGTSFAMGGLWGGPYLMHVYGLSKTETGNILSTFALALIFGSPLLGWLANRVGRKPVLMGCSLLLMTVSGLMAWSVNSLPIPALYILFFCLFLAGGPTGPVVATVSKELFPIEISGTSVGTVNLFPFLGAAVLQVGIGAMLTARNPGQAVYDATSFRYMFLILLGVATLSFVASFLIRETLPADNTA